MIESKGITVKTPIGLLTVYIEQGSDCVQAGVQLTKENENPTNLFYAEFFESEPKADCYVYSDPEQEDYTDMFSIQEKITKEGSNT